MTMPLKRRVIDVLALLAVIGGVALAQPTELRVAIWSDIPGFDPHGLTAAVPTFVYPNIFDQLVFRDTDGAVQPALATEWTSLDETAWRFTLRQGVVWHDGEPFTAADVKFTLERVGNDNTLPRHPTFSVIDRVEIIDDHEVIIHTTGPDPVLINRLAGGGGSILPLHYFERVGVEGITVAPIGTGPFRFVEHQPDARLTLEAFPEHWRGPPHFDRLIFRIIPEYTTGVSELLAGGVDIVTRVEPPDLPRLERRGDIVLHPVPAPRHVVWYVNTDESVETGDVRVRRAIDYAINNQLIIDSVLGGYGTPVRARVSPGVLHAPMEHYGTFNYDPELAVELLREAGYGPGDLTITIHSYGPTDHVEVIGAMLEAVGMNVNLVMLEQTAYNTRVWDNQEFTHLAYASVGNTLFDYGDALSILHCPTGRHYQRGGWCHEEFSDLVADARFEIDPERRAELLARATAILLEEVPQIYPYTIERIAAHGARVNWRPRQDETWWMFDARMSE